MGGIDGVYVGEKGVLKVGGGVSWKKVGWGGMGEKGMGVYELMMGG